MTGTARGAPLERGYRAAGDPHEPRLHRQRAAHRLVLSGCRHVSHYEPAVSDPRSTLATSASARVARTLRGGDHADSRPGSRVQAPLCQRRNQARAAQRGVDREPLLRAQHPHEDQLQPRGETSECRHRRLHSIRQQPEQGRNLYRHRPKHRGDGCHAGRRPAQHLGSAASAVAPSQSGRRQRGRWHARTPDARAAGHLHHSGAPGPAPRKRPHHRPARWGHRHAGGGHPPQPRGPVEHLGGCRSWARGSSSVVPPRSFPRRSVASA